LKKINEQDLVLHCLGESQDTAARTEIERSGPYDWDAIFYGVQRHSVIPLFYHRLKNSGLHEIAPPEILQQLRDSFLRFAAKNMRIYHQLSQLLTLLQENEVKVIALKGAHLAEEVYGNIDLRNMSDVDLMVRREDLGTVEKLFIELGYGSANRPSVEEQMRCHHLVPFITRQGLPLEVHWTITRPSSPFKIDVDELWRRARPATIAGVDALVLSPEDLLVHLSLHGFFQHQFEMGLKTFCDVRETILHYSAEIEWNELESSIRRYHCRNCTHLTLYLSSLLLDVELPGKIVRRMKWDPLVKYLSARVVERLLLDDRDLTPREKFIWHFKIRDRFADRVRDLLVKPEG